MNLPDRLQQTLDGYKPLIQPDRLFVADLIHLYPAGSESDDRYHDCQHFDLVAYCFVDMTVAKLGRHDALDFPEAVEVVKAGIFLDGSMFVRFKRPVEIDWSFNEVRIKPHGSVQK